MYFNIGSVPEINVSPSLINGNVFVGKFENGKRTETVLFNGKKVESIVTPGGNNNDKKVEKEIMRRSNSKTSEFDLQKGISKSYMPSKK
jgi:hypothetical protein